MYIDSTVFHVHNAVALANGLSHSCWAFNRRADVRERALEGAYLLLLECRVGE